MKKLIFSLSKVLFLSVINTAYNEQMISVEDQLENPAMDTINALFRNCHNTGTSYSVIEISDDAWLGHEAHSDILYVKIPEVGVLNMTSIQMKMD